MVHMFRTRSLGGLPIRGISPEKARDEIIDIAKSDLRSGTGVHLVNAFTLALAHGDERYFSVLRNAGINLPDGKPLAWITRFSKRPLTQVRGPQFFLDVLDEGRKVTLKHFLLGGSDATLKSLTYALQSRYPGILIVGAFSPPFRSMTEQEIAEQDQLIDTSRADIVWVGLGTPKQDFEVERIAASLPVVACAVGAAFDFAAGTKREAPKWMTKVGLEWTFRFATEPRRLWRRYLIGNFVFLHAVWSRRSS